MLFVKYISCFFIIFLQKVALKTFNKSIILSKFHFQRLDKNQPYNNWPQIPSSFKR